MKTKSLSIRFTNDERARLERAAGNKPLSAYIRDKLLDDYVSSRKVTRKPRENSILLAQILAMLGKSDVPTNMRQLADSARIGSLPDTPDVIRDINAACLTIEKIRYDLIKALGLRPEDQ